MAAQKLIHANCSNAQLSTGPRAEQGKAISRRNALKTGIDARNEAASGKDLAALTALAAVYDHEFHPIGVLERLLVDIKNDWFLRRYRFLAADLVNHRVSIADEAKRGADSVAGFAANTNTNTNTKTKTFHPLHRHILDTERSFFTHLAELAGRQTLRQQHPRRSGLLRNPFSRNGKPGNWVRSATHPRHRSPICARSTERLSEPEILEMKGYRRDLDRYHSKMPAEPKNSLIYNNIHFKSEPNEPNQPEVDCIFAKIREIEYANIMPNHLRAYKASVFQALAHPTRIAIVEILRHGELSAGALQARLGIEQANLSQHLTILRSRQIVVNRKGGNQVFYSLPNPVLGEVLDIMRHYCQTNLNQAIQMMGEMNREAQG